MHFITWNRCKTLTYKRTLFDLYPLHTFQYSVSKIRILIIILQFESTYVIYGDIF